MTPLPLAVHVLRPVSSEEAEVLARAGVTAVVHLPWSWAEKRKGAWSWESVDHFLGPLRAASVPLLGVLGPCQPHLLPPFAAAQVDEVGFASLFADYARRAAQHCSDIAVFRVEDELPSARWEQLRTRRRRGQRWASAERRQQLLGAGLHAVGQARPDARLQVTVRTLPGWTRSVARWVELGLPFHELGLSALPCAWLPDPDLAAALGDGVARAKRLLDHRGARTPEGGPVAVSIARTGYATASDRFPPGKQRRFLVRAVEEARAAGAAGLGWWALRDQAFDDPLLGYWTPARERHMGLLYYDGVPKAAMDELRVLATGDRFGEGA